MIDYSKIVIYKIQHIINKQLFYVGSTTNFKRRRETHRRDWNKRGNNLYDMICENGGWTNFEMSMIKNFPCKNINEVDAEKTIVSHSEEMKAYLTSLNLEKSA